MARLRFYDDFFGHYFTKHRPVFVADTLEPSFCHAKALFELLQFVLLLLALVTQRSYLTHDLPDESSDALLLLRHVFFASRFHG